MIKVIDGYEDLARVLELAYEQSAKGKGIERHGLGIPFEDQPIMTIQKFVGPGFATGQAIKKIQEAKTMYNRGKKDAAMAELLGAIIYCAGAYLHIEEGGRE